MSELEIDTMTIVIFAIFGFDFLALFLLDSTSKICGKLKKIKNRAAESHEYWNSQKSWGNGQKSYCSGKGSKSLWL